jgi:quercetin dioxygenase-like cupin family protein
MRRRRWALGVDRGDSARDLAPVRLLTLESIEPMRVAPRGVEDHQWNRPLLSQVLTGTPQMVADFITMPPAFVHRMHRHPNADQIMLPLGGRLLILDETGSEQELTVGQLLVIPRWNWHEPRNITDEDCRVFNLFSGVGDAADIGFESWAR